MTKFSTSMTHGFIHIYLEDVGSVLISIWLPFRRWRIERAHRSLLQLQSDLAYAADPIGEGLRIYS